MAKWIVVAVAVLGVALAIRVAAGVAHVNLNPVSFVQSFGDENEPDENEGGSDSHQSGGEGD